MELNVLQCIPLFCHFTDDKIELEHLTIDDSAIPRFEARIG